MFQKGRAHSLDQDFASILLPQIQSLCPRRTYFSVYKMGYNVYLREICEMMYTERRIAATQSCQLLLQFTKRFPKQYQQRQPCGINSSDIAISDLQPRELGFRDVKGRREERDPKQLWLQIYPKLVLDNI